MSKEESLKLLTIAAKYYNDKDTQMNTPALNEEQIEAGYISTTKYTKAQIDEAYNYLLNNSQGQTFIDTYKEDMTSQPYFTSTDEQYKNSNWKPDSTKGLEDNSLTFVPTVKVGVTTIKAGVEVAPFVVSGGKTVVNSVTKKADEVYDAGTLKVTEAVGQISPKAIDAETAVKGATAVGVVNDVFNPAEPIPSSNEIGKGLSFIKNTYEQATDDFEATDAFLNKIISNQTNE